MLISQVEHEIGNHTHMLDSIQETVTDLNSLSPTAQARIKYLFSDNAALTSTVILKTLRTASEPPQPTCQVILAAIA